MAVYAYVGVHVLGFLIEGTVEERRGGTLVGGAEEAGMRYGWLFNEGKVLRKVKHTIKKTF